MVQSSARGAARLRIVIAEVIATEYKSYQLPDLGERLGLAAGSDQEAFNSKRMYITKRLQKLTEVDLISVARELAKDVYNHDLDQMLIDHSPSDGSISAALDQFNKEVVHKRWSAALERRGSDPEGAITLARTLLEDVIKWLLTAKDVSYDEKADLPVLYRLLAASLNLAPDQHTEEVFKRILGSCQSVVESLGTLRNKLRDAHSAGPLKAKPHARHAELAVNLAGAMATFLISTWDARQTNYKDHQCPTS